MASYSIQLKDENGNRQYPVSTTNIVVDADGVSVADLLDRKQPTLVSGVNIKTINGKSILGSGDLSIEGGGGSSSEGVETRVLYCYIENGIELTEEEKAYNKETYDKIANGEDIQLVLNAIGLPVTHAYYEGDILFSASVYLDGVLVYGQGNLFSDGNTYYEENQIGGTGGEVSADPNNAKMFVLNAPFQGDYGELYTFEYIRTALDNFDIEIPQIIKDWWYGYITGLIEENVATMAQIKQAYNDGSKIMIVTKLHTFLLFILALYLWSLEEGGSSDATDEEFVEMLDMCKLMPEYIYPKSYEISPPIDGEPLSIAVTGDTIVCTIDESGEWAHTGDVELKQTYNLYYEGAARLDKDRCDANLIAMNRLLNYTDISVCEFLRSNGTYTVLDVLIISRKDKTVENFTDLDGSVNTREVASFYYLDGTNMYELQVSKYDGYCRRVSLGEVKFGNDSAGGLQFFVERYVYEGKTEEERTYNLESLAMLDQGIDILWAGIGPQPNYEGAMWHVRYEAGHFAYNATAEINAETGVLEMHNATFLRDFYWGNVSNTYKEYVKAFFAEEQWIYERAFYQGHPIISWFEETNTTVRAYFIGNGLVYSYVLINIETGEVSEPVIVQ